MLISLIYLNTVTLLFGKQFKVENIIMVMHELVHYNLTNTVVDKKKNFKRTLSNPPGAINMERISRQEATFKRTGSFVVGQKLRESKWFTHEEHKVLCAVLETGFIVESRNQNDESKFGIAVWTPGFGTLFQ